MQRYHNIRHRAACLALECIDGRLITKEYGSLSFQADPTPMGGLDLSYYFSVMDSRRAPLRVEFLGKTSGGCQHAVCQLLTGLRLLEQWDRAEADHLGHLEPEKGGDTTS